MKVKILASTKIGDDIDAKGLFDLAGKTAGICYMAHDIDRILNEDDSRTQNRINIVKNSGHHSVFDHGYITLYFEEVPKAFAMLLNNEKMYTTSEKSARYTKMKTDGCEKELYDKWCNIFIELISEKYGNEKYFDAKRIQKLAMENARYMLSVFTPATSFAYTASVRQLNYMYGWFKNLSSSKSNILKKLVPYGDEFCKSLEKLGIIDNDLVKGGAHRTFSFVASKNYKEVYEDVYSTHYDISLSGLAQAQRHRTLYYSIKEYSTPKFYVPTILKSNPVLVDEWLKDLDSIKENIPQATIVKVYERGTYENFLLKARERCCTCVQLEVQGQTIKTMKKYASHTSQKDIQNTLTKLSSGARCLNGYKCATPCAFADGIKLKRII